MQSAFFNVSVGLKSFFNLQRMICCGSFDCRNVVDYFDASEEIINSCLFLQTHFCQISNIGPTLRLGQNLKLFLLNSFEGTRLG